MTQSSLSLLLKWRSISHILFANFWPLEQSFSVGLKSLTSARDGIHKGAKPIRHPDPHGFLEKSWPEYFALLSELTALKCVGVQAIRALSRKCGMLGRVMTPLDETTGLFLQGHWGVLIFEPIIIQKQWQNIQLHRMTAWSRSCRTCQSFRGPMERGGGWLHWAPAFFFCCSPACWRNNYFSFFFFFPPLFLYKCNFLFWLNPYTARGIFLQYLGYPWQPHWKSRGGITQGMGRAG